MRDVNKSLLLKFAIFLGLFGVHRFYAGKIKSGILYALTYGLCGIGWIVDIILIANNKFDNEQFVEIGTNYTMHVKEPVNKMSSTSMEQQKTPFDVPKENTASNKDDKDEKIKKTIALILNPDVVIESYITTNHCTAPTEFSYFDYKQKEFETILNSLDTVDISISDDFKSDNTNFEYKSKNLTTKTNINKIKDFIALDTETTGLSAKKEKIVEVSAILFNDFKPISVFHTLINPRKNISAKITEINGITNEIVKDAPSFEQISKSLSSFISNYPIIAHNAEFDINFLVSSGLSISSGTVIYDTLELSKRLFEDLENYKLKTVCEDCCIYFSDAHRSTTDALAAGLLFNEIVKKRMETVNLYSLIRD